MSEAQASTTERWAQADLLLWIARALTPPTASDREPWNLEADELEQLARGSGLAARGHAALLQRTGALIRATDEERRAGEHARLFEAAQLCPPNETAYIRRDKGAVIADIAGFYRAFGFSIAPGPGEKDDHVVAELQFAALLLVLLAGARERGETENAQVTERALGSFAEDHLDAWLGAFGERMAATASLPLYRELAGLVLAAWELVVERNALPRSTGVAVDGVERDAGTPYECGMCEAAPVPPDPRPRS